MNEQGGDPGRPRPEVVSESVVVVSDSGGLASRSWGIVFAVGIVAIVFGVIVLANIWASVQLVAIFAGLFLLFAGILQFFVGGGARAGRIAAGVIAIIAGIALIAWPDASVKTIAVIIGLSFLISGVAVAIAAIASHGEGYGVVVGFGVILAVVGVVFIAWPGPT
ncbi:MAG: DUF308 domain-containing protein, partial [Thermoleophilia bacterium]|nr:DUF308 domain-containing protein [Thermoleophilia bacterium]